MKTYTCKKCGQWFEKPPEEHGVLKPTFCSTPEIKWTHQICNGEIIKSVHACKSDDWKKEYYGYRCKVCDNFIPYGCEPWLNLVS